MNLPKKKQEKEGGKTKCKIKQNKLKEDQKKATKNTNSSRRRLVAEATVYEYNSVRSRR
jgi:hypothetical protein